jgi:hypothetical protein
MTHSPHDASAGGISLIINIGMRKRFCGMKKNA